MSTKVSYVIDIKDDGTPALRKIGNEAERAEEKTEGLNSSLKSIGKATLAIGAVTAAFSKLWSVMEASDAAYKAQMTAETKLEQVMRNTMGATEEDVRAIRELTAAQQKLGVVGDEVQLAGAQQLAMHLKSKDALSALIPVMNDMAAQQYGLNATQESAASVAQLLGKAMDGQTSALTRVGITLTEAQEKALKYGDEQTRVAALAEIVGNRVGGMNAELAATPAGQMQQYANAMGDVSERLGELYNKIRTATLPYAWKMVEALNVMVDALGAIFSFVADNLDVLTALTVGITALTIAANAHAISAGIVTLATKAWAAAQAILNAIMYANPIGLVIAAIALLVAAILWVKKHTEGWGTVWDATLTFMKEGFLMWVDSIKLYFNTLVNGLMIGLDKIKEGWYKFKLAVGLGSEEENRKALQQIASDVEERQKAIAEGARKVMEHADKARHAFDGVSVKWKSGDESQSDTSSIKSNANAFGSMKSGVDLGGASSTAKQSADAIAAGGARNTQITINFSREMVKMDFNGGYMENKGEVETTLAESLLRVLSAAKASI